MTLRPATAGDAAFVAALWTAPAHAAFLTPPHDGQIAAGIADETLLIWQVDGQAAGFVALVEWVPQVWGIEAMVVVTPRQGHGAALLRATLDEVFLRRGAHRLGLDATVDNHAALALYARLGFVIEGRWRECWQRPGGDWVDCLFLSLLAREWRS